MSATGEPSPAREDRLVTLVSKEGEEMVITREQAEVSEVIKMSLDSKMREGAEQRIKFENISSPVLKVVVDYLKFKVEHRHSKAPVPEFKFDGALLVEVLQAAHYLNC